MLTCLIRSTIHDGGTSIIRKEGGGGEGRGRVKEGEGVKEGGG